MSEEEEEEEPAPGATPPTTGGGGAAEIVFAVIAVIAFFSGAILCAIGVYHWFVAIDTPGLQPALTNSADSMIILEIILFVAGRVFQGIASRIEKKKQQKQQGHGQQQQGQQQHKITRWFARESSHKEEAESEGEENKAKGLCKRKLKIVGAVIGSAVLFIIILAVIDSTTTIPVGSLYKINHDEITDVTQFVVLTEGSAYKVRFSLTDKDDNIVTSDAKVAFVVPNP
ncbi:MAG: hypothetical protein M3275_13505 [Thermoproteota archaeon]|nr:hypothetical protein [Thermoproteota archaeon]